MPLGLVQATSSTGGLDGRMRPASLLLFLYDDSTLCGQYYFLLPWDSKRRGADRRLLVICPVRYSNTGTEENVMAKLGVIFL